MCSVRNLRVQVFFAYHFLKCREPLGLVLFTVGILGIGLEMQEVGADRTVTIFESGQHDTVFHLCHFRACFDHQTIRRT